MEDGLITDYADGIVIGIVYLVNTAVCRYSKHIIIFVLAKLKKSKVIRIKYFEKQHPYKY